MDTARGRSPRRLASMLSASLCAALLVLGSGLSGCGGDEPGNSSGGAGSIDLTKKDEASIDAPKKSAAGLRGQGLGVPAPDPKGKR